MISRATGKKKNTRDEEFKLYLTDTGLFTTLLFNDESQAHGDIYRKLLSNNLSANLGFLYENIAAQIITASGRKLYYHVWRKEKSTHSYEVDFLAVSKAKVVPIEVKSSRIRPHDSLDAFIDKYARYIGEKIIVSGRDIGSEDNIRLWPLYCLPAVLERL